MGKGKNQKIENTEKKFTKKELLLAKKFKNRKDILSVVLKDNEEYTQNEAQEKIEIFMKEKVK